MVLGAEDVPRTMGKKRSQRPGGIHLRSGPAREVAPKHSTRTKAPRSEVPAAGTEMAGSDACVSLPLPWLPALLSCLLIRRVWRSWAVWQF